MATTMPNPTETGNAPVEEAPEPQEPITFGEKNRDLPKSLQDVLKDMVECYQREDLYNRRYEDIIDRCMRFYDDGVQHFYYNVGTGAYQIGATGAYIDVQDGDGFTCGDYMGAYNIFRARRRTIDSVLTQNPPGIDFQPVRPDRSEDIQAAETAEGYRHVFDQNNDVFDLQQSVTRFFELSGRCVAWTHSDTNRQKWGLNDAGEPKQMETAWVGGTLETTVPILARDQDDALYCFLYRDLHYLKLRAENPHLQDEDGTWKFKGGESGPGESDWKRYARLGVKQSAKGTQLIGQAIAHITTEMHCFLRPESFTTDKCDEPYVGPSGPDTEEPGEPQTVGEMLKKLFPEGVHIKYVGKAYSEATAESMDDAIDIVMSEKRDSLTGGALMEPMKIIQDGYNDFKNAEREYYEKGWPMTHFKGDQEDYDTIVGQASKPAQFNLVKNAVGGPEVPLANSFFREPDMTAPESFVQCMEEYRTALSQDVTGASPALEGVAGPKEETASQRAMDKTQSIGILGPTWSRVQRIFAGIYKKAALLASRNPDHGEQITVTTTDGTTAVIVLEKLSRGRFHAKPDTDSSFPDSTAAQRAMLDQTLPQIAVTPIGMEMLQTPQNWEEILRVKGMNDFTLIPAEAAKKQIREIELLAEQAPIPNPQFQQYQVQHAAMTMQAAEAGLPPPPYTPPPAEMPSIMPRKRDYHQWELAECARWLSSESCWRLEVQGEQLEAGESASPSPMPGYSDNPHVRNVELHADIHEQMMQMQAMAAAPPVAMPPAKGNAQAPQAAAKVQGQAQPPGAPNQPTL